MYLNYEIKYVVVVEIHRFRIWSIWCKISVDHALMLVTRFIKYVNYYVRIEMRRVAAPWLGILDRLVRGTSRCVMTQRATAATRLTLIAQ